MSSAYVCSRCRLNLVRRANLPRAPRALPLQPRAASFISLAQQPPSNNAQGNEQTYEATEDAAQKQWDNPGVHNPAEALLHGMSPPLKGQSSLQSARGQQHRPRPRASRYTARFEEEPAIPTPKPKPEPKPEPEPEPETAVDEPPQPRDGDVVLVDQAIVATRRLHTLVEAGELKAAWSHFAQRFAQRNSEAPYGPSLSHVPLVKKAPGFRELLRAIVFEHCNGAEVPISPALALLRYEQAGLARPEVWADTLSALTTQLVLRTAESSPDEKLLDNIFSELMAAWRLFFQSNGRTDLDTTSIDDGWRNLPNSEHLSKMTAASHSSMTFAERLQKYLPQIAPHNDYPLSAALLFCILNREGSLVSRFRSDAEYFLNFVARLLAGTSSKSLVTSTQKSESFQRMPAHIIDMYTKALARAPAEAKTTVSVQSLSGKEAAMLSPEEAREKAYLKRINRAVLERSHARMLETLWEEVLQTYVTSRKGNHAAPRRIYNAFLTGFLSMSRPDAAVQIWNHMVQHGIQPDVRTWTAMITGCEKAKDEKGLQQTWARMVQTGVQPDLYAWTARVHGLMALRNLKAGFAALDEMGKIWLAAEAAVRKAASTKPWGKNSQLPINPHPKPSTEVINGAIGAIANLPSRVFDRNKEISKILRWAGSFTIKPDAITYNTMIRLALSTGENNQVMALLRQMEGENIEPDIATYTMLLNAAFENQQMAQRPHGEQTEHVLALLADLETRGLKLNRWIYSSVIDKLLKQFRNTDAVRRVMDHMLARQLAPSAHIYTSLFTHYFQQQPPDIPSVDSLWLQLMSTPGTSTDKYLFDRVIEGYAAAGEVGKMMSVLAKMGAHGKLPSWSALTHVVSALAETGDMDRARGIVRDVADGVGVARGGILGEAFKRGVFWDTVYMYHLGVPKDDKGEDSMDGEGRVNTSRDVGGKGGELRAEWNGQEG